MPNQMKTHRYNVVTPFKAELVGAETPDEQVKCTVSGVLMLLFRISRVLGTTPVQLKKTCDGCRVQVSQAMRVLHFILISLITAAVTVELVISLLSGELKSNSLLLSFVVALSVTVDSAVAVYGAPKRIQVTISCLDRIQKINSSIGCEKKFVAELKKVIGLALCVAFFSVCSVLSFLKQTFEEIGTGADAYKIIYFISHLVQYAVLYMLTMEFFFCALDVCATLCSINDILEYITITDLKGIEGAFTSKHSTQQLKEVIRHLAQMYGEVCDVVKQLNDSYGVCLVLIVGSCFLHLIYVPYTLIVSFSTSEVGRTVVLLMWFALNFCMLFSVTYSGHRTMMQMERGSLLTSALLTKVEDGQLSEELYSLSLNFILNKVTYNPMGFCTLSRGLMATMIAAVTSYLIIVIQF